MGDVRFLPSASTALGALGALGLRFLAAWPLQHHHRLI